MICSLNKCSGIMETETTGKAARRDAKSTADVEDISSLPSPLQHRQSSSFPSMPTARRGVPKRSRTVLLMIPFSLVLVLATVARQLQSGMVVTLEVSGDINAPVLGTGTPSMTVASEKYHRTSKGTEEGQGATIVASKASPSHVALNCDPPGFERNRSFIEDEEEICLRQFAATLSRVWKSKPTSEWCPASHTQLGDAGNPTRGEQSVGGIVLIKVPKSASSTVAGMVLHAAAAAEATSGSSSTSSPSRNCPVEWEHARASESPTLQWIEAQGSGASSNKTRPFLLLAPIRDPLARALSDVYYHQVSLGSGARKSPQDSFVIRQLNRVPPNFILQYISPHKADAVAISLPSDNLSVQGFDHHHPPFRIPRELVEQVQSAVQLYDFWVVVDRFVESVVVLSNLTGTSWHRYMTMPSKVAGSYYRSSPSKCVQLVPPVLTPRVLQHARDSWNARNLGDWLLYHVANASLDRTIDSIGRDWVMQQVHQVRAFQDHVRATCANETYFPCSPSGQVQAELSKKSCYARDFGCGHACVRRESQLWESNHIRHNG
jgi:hypothetical protein